MSKKILMAFVAVVAMAAIAPSMASATGYPALHATDTQAYLLDSSGNPITSTTTITMSGRLTLDGAAQVTCDSHFTIDVAADGTTTVKAPSSFTNCQVDGINNCTVSAVPNLNMGDRFVLDANGDFRDRINVSLTNTYSGAGCPFGPITYTGELSPVLTVNGLTGAVEATFDGAAAGSLSSPLGGAIATGTVTEQGTLGNYGFGI